jgi:predicted RecB family nuclease
MPAAVTASMLYDLVACPHRVAMDLYGDPARRDEPNAFVTMLWERGSLYEREVIAGVAVPFLDLSPYAGEEKERLTLEAMRRGEPLIYNGRIAEPGLLGNPDLLRRQGGGYIAGDIKSGAGEEGPDDNPSPKLHYAVQLALYTDILERKGLSSGRRAFVWDIHGDEVPYDFTVLHGTRNPRTLWQDYEECLAEARAIIADPQRTRAAYSSACKFCHWYSPCIGELVASDDLTLIPELGRPRREAMFSHLQTVRQLAASDPAAFMTGGKTMFHGVGTDTLQKFHTRAILLSTKDPRPILRAPVDFPADDRELFFDIEVDPMRDICYLHGFIERRGRNNATERFVAFFADDCTPAGERGAFAAALRYLRESRPCAVYYYSKYERTIYRKLRKKYPHTASAAEIEDLFDPAHAVDLYTDVVRKATEWPTWDFSIKTLAKYLGFAWRDTHPSGAASIEWFDRWIKTGDPAIRQRILDYNEDDCRATRVLLDGIRNLPPAASA